MAQHGQGALPEADAGEDGAGAEIQQAGEARAVQGEGGKERAGGTEAEDGQEGASAPAQEEHRGDRAGQAQQQGAGALCEQEGRQQDEAKQAEAAAGDARGLDGPGQSEGQATAEEEGGVIGGTVDADQAAGAAFGSNDALAAEEEPEPKQRDQQAAGEQGVDHTGAGARTTDFVAEDEVEERRLEEEDAQFGEGGAALLRPGSGNEAEEQPEQQQDVEGMQAQGRSGAGGCGLAALRPADELAQGPGGCGEQDEHFGEREGEAEELEREEIERGPRAG